MHKLGSLLKHVYVALLVNFEFNFALMVLRWLVVQSVLEVAVVVRFVGQNGLNKVLLLIGRVNVAMAVLHLVLVASDVAPVGLSVVDSVLGLRSVVLVVTVSMRISMLSIHVAEFTTVEGLV